MYSKQFGNAEGEFKMEPGEEGGAGGFNGDHLGERGQKKVEFVSR